MIYNQIVTWTAFAILAMFIIMIEIVFLLCMNLLQEKAIDGRRRRVEKEPLRQRIS